ncbi:unnamed protein product [Nippostrongylus brasiliensis]|uniref:Reverse transcriptase domain-containing protein n=1 Tax=Nippostrongylus brasiliensis TaxID=27835 RepID=A0A0N4XCT7_NIPBR|nr:unnamed protein product [Nippostrongylus brasiliensis]
MIKVGDRMAKLDIQRGARQGDTLSPLLFILTLQHVLNNTHFSNRGIEVNGKLLSYMAYADDIALLARTSEELQTMGADLMTESQKVGLNIIFDKTKWMRVRNNRRHSEDDSEEQVELNGNRIQGVNEYVYLGQLITTPRNQLKEIRRRMQAGRAIYFKHRKFLCSSSVAISLKRKLINTCILPAVIHGCETWAWTKEMATILQSAQRRLERAIFGIRLAARIKSQAIRRRSGLKDRVTSALR